MLLLPRVPSHACARCALSSRSRWRLRTRTWSSPCPATRTTATSRRSRTAARRSSHRVPLRLSRVIGRISSVSSILERAYSWLVAYAIFRRGRSTSSLHIQAHIAERLAGTCANGVGGNRSAETHGCELGPLKANSGRGQACLWWSQGCSIHCPYCVTQLTGPTPDFESKRQGIQSESACQTDSRFSCLAALAP